LLLLLLLLLTIILIRPLSFLSAANPRWRTREIVAIVWAAELRTNAATAKGEMLEVFVVDDNSRWCPGHYDCKID
jgi:hypothetical protein